LSPEVQLKVENICKQLWHKYGLPVHYSFGLVANKFNNHYGGSKRATDASEKRKSPSSTSSSPSTALFSGRNLPPKGEEASKSKLSLTFSGTNLKRTMSSSVESESGSDSSAFRPSPHGHKKQRSISSSSSSSRCINTYWSTYSTARSRF
jgi:hypothetical protein